MGKKSSDSPPPEYYEALQKQNELAEQQQQWFETEIYPWLKEQAEISNQNAVADRELNQQNAEWWQNYAKEQTDRQNAIADEYYDRFKTKYQPVEDTLLKQYSNYKDGVEAERQAGYAIGDVASSYATQRAANKMRAEAYGLNPTSGAYQAQQNALMTNQAALQAAAANQARATAQEIGWNKGMQLAGLGQNYINATQGMYGTANQTAGTAGNLAQNATNAGFTAGQQGLQNVGSVAGIGLQSYSGLQNAWGNVANGYFQAHQSQQQAKSEAAGNVGAIIGTVGTVAAAAF